MSFDEPSFGDVVVPLPPEQLAPPEERGFVVRPDIDDLFNRMARDFGLADEYGNITDPEGANLLWQGWFNFQDLDFDDVVFTRDAFFDYVEDYDWSDFDEWREYISEYLGAA